MNKWIVQISIVLLICTLVVGILGCAPQTPAKTSTTTSTATTVAPKTLKYGFSSALTGPAAAWGTEFKRGHELAVAVLNDRGGLKVGSDRYKVELITYDNKYSGTEGVATTNKMVFSDNIKFMTIHLGAAILPSLPITEPNNIFVMAAAFAAGIVDAKNKLTFRGQYTNAAAAEGVYGYVATNMKDIKNVVIVSNDDDTGKATLNQSSNVATAKGFNVIDKILVPRGTADYYPTLAKILTLNPDMIDGGALSPSDLGLMAKQAREKGFKGPFCNTGAIDVPTLVSVAGKSADGILTPELNYTSDIATPEQKAMAIAYNKNYGGTISGLAGSGGIMFDCFVAGVEAAQSLDPIKVAATLPDIKFKAQGVDMRWGGEKTFGIKHQIVQPIWVSEVRDGKLVTRGQFTPDIP